MAVMGKVFRRLCSLDTFRTSVSSRGIFWWGHDTLEDQMERQRKKDEAGAIMWTDPEQNLAEKKEYIWLPARIEREAELTVGVTTGLVNVADWFAMTCKTPHWYAFFSDPVLFMEESRRRQHRRLVVSQLFIKQRLTTLGPDLAAAHFLCHRNCRVRFRGNSEWTELEPNGDLNIPNVYMKGWNIEAIDCAASVLVYEGLQNLRNLVYLKYLDLSYCPNIDVWCFDRLTGEYMTTLEYLDISGCRKLDWNALETIWRLHKLRTLVMKDMDHVKDLPLICLMLLDVNPKLKIVGVEYIDKTLLEGTEYEYLLLDDSKFLSLEPGELEEAQRQKN